MEEKRNEIKEKVVLAAAEKATVEAIPVEPPKQSSTATVRDVATALRDKLTNVNIIVNPSEKKYPYVEIGDDFGECELSFEKVGNTQIKLHCYVEKGFNSTGRARAFSARVLDVVRDEYTIGSRRVKIAFSQNTEHSEAGARYVTLCLIVTRTTNA